MNGKKSKMIRKSARSIFGNLQNNSIFRKKARFGQYRDQSGTIRYHKEDPRKIYQELKKEYKKGAA